MYLKLRSRQWVVLPFQWCSFSVSPRKSANLHRRSLNHFRHSDNLIQALNGEISVCRTIVALLDVSVDISFSWMFSEVNIFPLSLFLLSSLEDPLSTLSDPTAAELPLRVWIFWVVALSDPTAWLPLILLFVLLSSPDLSLALSLG